MDEQGVWAIRDSIEGKSSSRGKEKEEEEREYLQ